MCWISWTVGAVPWALGGGGGGVGAGGGATGGGDGGGVGMLSVGLARSASSGAMTSLGDGVVFGGSMVLAWVRISAFGVRKSPELTS